MRDSPVHCKVFNSTPKLSTHYMPIANLLLPLSLVVTTKNVSILYQMVPLGKITLGWEPWFIVSRNGIKYVFTNHSYSHHYVVVEVLRGGCQRKIALSRVKQGRMLSRLLQ